MQKVPAASGLSKKFVDKNYGNHQYFANNYSGKFE
jgi:hypothetical protein